MPPKKKVDPAVQVQQFEEWKTKDEYRIWVELQSLYKEFPYITETSIDLTGRWQVYHDKLFEMVQVFKVKTKLKEFKHEHVRSFFFAREDKELEKGQIEKYYIDGFHCSSDKEYSQAGWHLRRNFIEIQRNLDEVHELTAEEYQAKRKKLQTALNEFVKNFQKHVKSGHKQVYEEKLMMILTPLKNLLEINRRLFFFDMKNRTPQERLINEFVLKADIETYCQCLQESQKILFQFNHIVANPEVKKIFNKLAYQGWQENKIESFYLMPLQKAFDKMKLNLLCLMVKGINYYNIPLNNNKQFLDDLKEVINCELISEHLLGDALKRDQLNFMFKVQSVIFEANTLARDYLLKKDENCIEGSVPKLVVYMTILYMRNWLDRKQEDLLKLQKEKLKLATKQKFEEDQGNDDKQQSQSQTGFYMSPEKKKQSDEEQKRKDQMTKALEEQQKQQEQMDQEKYGRYWIWENYCDYQHRLLFEECVESIQHVNKAVQQDVQDEIIREGMIPRIKDRQSKELKEASDNLNKLRSKDNANLDSKMRRPPELWNYPKIVQEKHEFRSIADPKKCYIDGRIEQLEHNVKLLSEHLVTNKPQSWKELVDRVVDALKGQYNQNPSAIEPGK